MLEKPDVPDAHIIACLQTAFGLRPTSLDFLPLGADRSTAVYRAEAAGVLYFVKLRSDPFDTITVDVPKYMHDAGIPEIIPPLVTRGGQIAARVGDYNLILYPFIEGQGGFDRPLTDAHWLAFGRALQRIHSLQLPPTLAARIPCETYSDRWREQVRRFQTHVETTTFTNPEALALAALLREKRDIITHIVSRAAELADQLRGQGAHPVLCHSDIHVGNLLLTTADALYIVDWDQPILAHKERDLMFVGGGIGGSHNPQHEEALFYSGYGAVTINWIAMAYYRYERIVQDIVAYCEQLLLTNEGGADRAQGLRQMTGQFAAGDVIDKAFRTEAHL